MIIGTDKDADGALYVFDMMGNIIKSKSVENLRRPTNVDIAYGVALGGRKIDIAVTTERLTGKLRVFSVPDMQAVDGGGIPVFQGEANTEFQEPMGIALYKRPSDGNVYAIVSRKNGPTDQTYLWQYLLKDDGQGNMEGILVRKFGKFSGEKEIEAVAVDNELGYVYYSDEKVGVRKYYADPAKGNEELALFATSGFAQDQEGIAIYKTEDNGGYILVSDQSADEIHVYPREGSTSNPHQHSLLAVVELKAHLIDGIEVLNYPIAPEFPKGLFVAMSEGRTYHLYRWEDIAGKTLKVLPPDNTTTPANSDHIPPTVLSINRQLPAEDSTSATQVTYRVTFSEPVTGADQTDFSVNVESGTLAASVKAIAAADTTSSVYDVTVSEVSGSGTLRLDLNASGTGIVDKAQNEVSEGYTAGQVYQVLQPQTGPAELIAFNATWRYLDNGSDQGTAWRTASFDDSAWETGNGKFGYGIPDAATPVSFGDDADRKHITTYFRKKITIANAAAISSFPALVNRDDGVVVYVNGAEVYRNNMPEGTVSYNTLAAGSSDGDDGATPIAFSIPPEAFLNGENTIAVEIHQYKQSSSDIAFDLELAGNSETANVELVRGPYLQMGSQSAITIRWRTSEPSDSRVEAGTQFGTYTLAASDARVSTEHEVRLEGLAPDTRYFYRVGSSAGMAQNSASNYFRTAPTATTTRKMRFAVFGDSGINKNNVRTNTLTAYLDHVGDDPAEVMLILGDNAYDKGTDREFQQNFFGPFDGLLLQNHVLFPTPGNHDYYATTQASRMGAYYQNFTMPKAAECGGEASGTEAFYSFDWGNIHFLSLDSYGVETDDTRLYDTLGAQVNWVKKDLAGNTKPWVIAFWHHPPYTMGSHNADKEDELIQIRQNFIRILERAGVDLVLSGHSHTYERSYLLNDFYGSEKTFDRASHTISQSSARYDNSANSCPYFTRAGQKNKGTVYVVSGSSGQSTSVQADYPHDALPFSRNEGGMFLLEVEDNRLDGKFIQADGSVTDQFTVMQDVNKTRTIAVQPGGTAQLTASWVGNYQWSTGETTRSITVMPYADISYMVSDDCKCLSDLFRLTTGTLTATTAGDTALAKTYTLPVDYPSIYPNPFSAKATVRFASTTSGECSVVLFNSKGQLIKTLFEGMTLAGETKAIEVDGAQLPTGLYFVRVQTAGSVRSVKLLLTR
ncbi:phytase [Pontibacter sp. E15-1]|nr:phytase [Pontibacter sp. E15-1]